MPAPHARLVRAAVVGGALLATSCASPGLHIDALAVAPERGADEASATQPQAAADKVDGVHVVVPASGRRVRWLEDGDAVLAVTPGVTRQRSIVGTDVGVVGLDNQTLLVFERNEGLVGQARVDAPSWFGVLEDDRILVSENRDLFRGDVDKALTGAWDYLGSYYDTTAWDTSGPYFVRATPWALYLSTDAGDSFTEVFKAPAGEDFFNTEVRADGVIAVISSDAEYATRLYLSRDGGKTFELSTFQPPSIGRSGARLQYQTAGCTWALSADGVDWVRDDSWDDSGNWNDLGEIGRTPVWRADAHLQRNDEPPAPDATAGSTVTGAPPPCELAAPLPEMDTWSATPEPAPCALGGLGCLANTAGPPAVAGRHDYGFLGDGVCSPADACTSPLRQPTLVTWDRDTGYLDPVALPAACEVPSHVSVARGLGVLTCSDGAATRYDVFVRSQSAGWTLELTLPAGAQPVAGAQSADGTLVIYRDCAARTGLCDVHLRPPVEVGATQPWRAIEGDDIIALRALDGGQILTVHSEAIAAGSWPSPETATDLPASLVLTVADGTFWGDRFVLLDDIALEAPIADITVGVTGRVLLTSDPQAGDGQVYGVERDGTLTAAGP